MIAGGQRFSGPVTALSSIEATARAHTRFVSVAMVHEAECTHSEFDDLCGRFMQQGVDAFIFLTPTDEMFQVACRAKVTQPCVIITSTHGGVSVGEGRFMQQGVDAFIFLTPTDEMFQVACRAKVTQPCVIITSTHGGVSVGEGMFMQQGVDAFIFLTPTDEMFQVACRAKVTQPCVIITSTHGGVSVGEGMRMLNARRHRRVSLVGVDQWGGMAAVMVTQPCVIITSTHGGVSVGEGMRMLNARRHRRVSLVGVDQWGGMAAVMRLIRKYGHRNVLFFAGPSQWRDAHTRLLAWNKLCAENKVNSVTVQCGDWESADAYRRMNHILDNIGSNGGRNSVTVQCGDWESADAYRRMNHILDNIGSNGGRLPTCAVCSNDVMAIGVIRALHEHGVRVPDDMSVTGFDDIPGMSNMYPPLTTVRQDFDDLGVMAMKEALFLMGDGDEPGYPASYHGVGLVSADLIVRQSVRAAPRR